MKECKYKYSPSPLLLEEGKEQESIQSSTTPHGKVTKTQENITHKRAKSSGGQKSARNRQDSMTNTIKNHK